MEGDWSELPELRRLGANLQLVRLERGSSQGKLAQACGLSQAQVSLFEVGRRLPSLDQLVRLARALDVPIQRLMTGTDRPSVGLEGLAVELRGLGAVDLWVADAILPGAARRPEEVIALAASGPSPDPRVVETLPALLSWNEIRVPLLRAHGALTRSIHRLAWLADVALTIERQKGFPGGCRKGPLERFLKSVKPPAGDAWDDLGRPSDSPPKFPAWKRWKISYPATLEQFEDRAIALNGYGQSTGIGVGRVARGRLRIVLGANPSGPSPQGIEPEIPVIAVRRRPRGGPNDGR